MPKLGQKIKEARRKRDITQEELAKAIGVTDKSISAYESGRITPPLYVLQKIAHKTDHSVSYFVQDTAESTILAKLTEIEQQFAEIKDLLRQQK